jgi:GH43 family beta-xylosidase
MSSKKVLVITGTLLLLISVFLGIYASDKIGKKKLNESNILNPIDVKFGDPFVLLASDGKYYMYGTDETGEIQGFSVYSSDNLADWKPEGQVYKGNAAGSWTLRNFWAPEVYERNGKFYMFFSADWKYNPTHAAENFRIGVAVSDKPTGPFRDISDKPLLDPGYPVIDANVLTYNGKTYLYYSRCCYKNPVKSEFSDWARKINLFQQIEESWIYGVEISSDFTSVIGEPVLLLQPPKTMNDKQAEWESRSVTCGEVNRRWTEGPFAFAQNNTIYIMYSANYFGGKNYAVGYATSSQPLGTFIKASNNPILQKNTDRGGIVTGTGHNCVIRSKDGKNMYCVYHGRTSQTGDKRVVFIDKMEINKNGLLSINGPTTNKKVL